MDHEYKDLFGICAICYKPQTDHVRESHGQQVESELNKLDFTLDKEETFGPCECGCSYAEHTDTGECQSCKCSSYFEAKEDDEEEKSDQPTNSHPVIPITTPEPILSTAKVEEEKICPMHKCSKCGALWEHDYDCWTDAMGPRRTLVKGLCEKCAQQAAADINRPTHIEAIKQDATGTLTGREWTEICLEHHGFIVLELCTNRDGSKRAPEDSLSSIRDHIADIKRKIAVLRAKESEARKVMTDLECEQISNLSPDEIEEYRKNARKQAAGATDKPKKSKKEKEPKNGKKDTSAYDALLRDLIKQVKTKSPTMSADEVQKKAEAKLKAMEEMD